MALCYRKLSKPTGGKRAEGRDMKNKKLNLLQELACKILPSLH